MLKAENRACDWVKKSLNQENIQLTPLAGDASFRRYYRVFSGQDRFILMDSPPQQEPLKPFLAIEKRLRNQELCVPKVHFVSENLGLALLEDFGDTLLLNIAKEKNSVPFYHLALKALNQMQKTPAAELPCFDKKHTRKELQLFTEWFLNQYLQLTLTSTEQNLIETTFDYLSTEIEKQPKVFIHRDFHSRNLMLVSNSESVKMGILDFQDAMLGPFTYDLASLLKDCYIQWPKTQIMAWVKAFHTMNTLAQNYSLEAFFHAFEHAALQRHLKVLGIFSRLHLRDHKRQYLQDLPLTLHYVLAYLETDPKLAPFYTFLQKRVNLP